MRRVLAVMAMVGLAACVPESEMNDDLSPDACGAGGLQHLLGTDAAAFDFAALDVPVRIIPPGTAVTMDYSPDRLNVETDEAGLILRIRCG